VSHLSEPTAPVARRVAHGVAVLAIGVAFLSACGGDSAATQADSAAGAGTSSESSAAPTTADGSSSAESGTTGSITATEEDFSISLDENSLSAGTYEIEVVNNGNSTHDFVVERDGKDVGGTNEIQPGKSATLTVTLEPGDYVFYCSIGAHRSMGMETDVSVS
jgi:plastocyanin